MQWIQRPRVKLVESISKRPLLGLAALWPPMTSPNSTNSAKSLTPFTCSSREVAQVLLSIGQTSLVLAGGPPLRMMTMTIFTAEAIGTCQRRLACHLQLISSSHSLYGTACVGLV